MTKRSYVAIGLSAASLLGLGGTAALSPYGSRAGFPYRLIAEGTEIALPCERVFSYLGNSAHAADWSVYVDHITHLNPATAADGDVASIRRSFRNADETGMRWDEYFTQVVPNRRRQLRIYNLVDAPLRPDQVLLTEQLYEPLEPARCRLTLTLFFEREPSAADELGMHVASFEIAGIFRRNIAAIKRITEQRAATGAP